MRISPIAPVGRNTYSPVDPVSWHEPSSNVRAIEINEAARRGAFQKAMEKLEDNTHQTRTRVLEVVFAPGVTARYVRSNVQRS